MVLLIYYTHLPQMTPQISLKIYNRDQYNSKYILVGRGLVVSVQAFYTNVYSLNPGEKCGLKSKIL